MIIVEGPDNAGKSTLVTALCEKLVMPSIHSGGPPSSYYEMVKRMSEQLLMAERDVIFDRVTCISEPIYRMMDYNVIINEFQQLMVHQPKVTVIYCRPPDHIVLNTDNLIFKSHDSDDHRKYVLKNHLKIVKKYDEYMNFNIPHIRYDYNKMSVEQLLSQILVVKEDRDGRKRDTGEKVSESLLFDHEF